VAVIDPGTIAVSIPVIAIVCVTIIKVAHVIGGQRPPAGLVDATNRLDAMEQEITDLRRQLTEAEERLDFAERLLTRGKDQPGSG
jgi:hypothetical protein